MGPSKSLKSCGSPWPTDQPVDVQGSPWSPWKSVEFSTDFHGECFSYVYVLVHVVWITIEVLLSLENGCPRTFCSSRMVGIPAVRRHCTQSSHSLTATLCKACRTSDPATGPCLALSTSNSSAYIAVLTAYSRILCAQVRRSDPRPLSQSVPRLYVPILQKIRSCTSSCAYVSTARARAGHLLPRREKRYVRARAAERAPALR